MGIVDMIETDEHGVTLKPSLVWAILVTILTGGIWVGTTVASINGTLDGMEKAESARVSNLESMQERIRNLENNRSATDINVSNMREDLRDLKATFKVLEQQQIVTNQLLRGLTNQNSGANPFVPPDL